MHTVPRLASIVAGALAVLLAGARAQTPGCEPAWLPLGTSMDEAIWALEEFSDGQSPAVLCAGGWFTLAGGAPMNHVAAWDGASWSPLGGGLDGGVLALQTIDLGAGPALYAGGSFGWVGGQESHGVARWDGVSWQPLGSGLEGFPPTCWALQAFDDGSGPALYVAGWFSTAGAQPAQNIARWDGVTWSGLGEGLDGIVRALAVYDDGSGEALYAGGTFQHAGGLPAQGIARWDGTTWSPLLPGPAGEVDGAVTALAPFDDGSGSRLWIGRQIEWSDSDDNLLTWDGATLATLDSPLVDESIHDLLVHDDGTGPALFAAGAKDYFEGFTFGAIARWDGTAWSPLGSGVSGSYYGFVSALAVFDDAAGGRRLMVGGNFLGAGGLQGDHFASWGGCSNAWDVVGPGTDGFYGVPQTHGVGSLVAGTAGAIVLSLARHDSPALMLVSTSSTPMPFKGGVLVPVPVTLAVPWFTGGGTTSIEWLAWPAGVPSGQPIYVQFAIQDQSAYQGVALSTALRAIAP